MQMNRWIVACLGVVGLVALVVLVGCPGKQTSTVDQAPAPETATTAETTQPAGGTQEAYTYVCPMHPDQTADKPGKCSVCGMYLEADTDEEVEYYCPHHPDVVQDTPGECEKCDGMLLSARPKA